MEHRGLGDKSASLVDRNHIKVDSLTGDKTLDTLVSELENLLKPYTHDTAVRIERFGNAVGTIVFEATIRTKNIR